MLSGRCRMRVGESWRKLTSSDLAALDLWATAGVLLHNELATLDDAFGGVPVPRTLLTAMV